MATKTINVGLVGQKFMDKAHSNAYMTVAKCFDVEPRPVMKAICARDATELAPFAARFGWESYETDWRKLVARKDIDVIDIAAPSNVHRDIGVSAAEAGKHVFCEKPLASTLPLAREMLDAVRKAGVVHMVNFNYRCCPALALAQQMIRAGEIGEVVGMQKTFITERPAEGRSSGLSATAGEGTEKVTVDDATLFLAKFANGAFGSFEATRLAPGRKNYNRVEINGSKGSLVFCFEDMNVLEYYNCGDPAERQGFRKIIATEGGHPFVGPWWPPGHMLGYEHTFVHAVYELMRAINGEPTIMPDFRDGAQCVAVLEAVEKSIVEGKWAKVEIVE